MLQRFLLISVSAGLALSSIATARADVITLASGGTARGTIVIPDDARPHPAFDPAETITIECLSGTQITFRRDDVISVTQRPRIEEEYLTRSRNAPDTLEAQWDLAEWCRRNHLDERRKVHLEAVIAIDPDHKTARAELGYVLRDGRWRKRAEIMRERGLVEYDRRWVTPQERDLMIETEKRREREQAWYTKIRLWHGWLRSGDPTRYREGFAEIRKLEDPTAIPALVKYFGHDTNESFRTLYLEALGRMPGSAAVEPLVRQHLLDVAPGVRDTAFGIIAAQHPEAALPYLLRGLRHDNNKVVRRAGVALEQLGDERVIPDLIKALITAHRKSIQVPQKVPTTTFSSNGAYGPSGIPLPPEIAIALRTGNLPYGVNVTGAGPLYRMRTVTIRVNHENQEVLDALQKISGESFGFDERVWQQWWTGKKSGL